ncbi:hypothetical protein ZWY2020_044533 [Hordeum vulgare]|nr:hypothetical protein ZWY2020_044533 [Hordeum vulgare]
MDGVLSLPALMEPQKPEVDSFRRLVDDLVSKTDLEKRVDEVAGFYNCKKHGSGGHKAGGSYTAANGARDGHCKGMPDLVRQFAGREIIRQRFVYVSTHVFVFPINTIIAWIINDYHERRNRIITNLLLPLGHISNKWKQEEPNDTPAINISREAAIAKLAEDTSNELKELQEMVVQRCRFASKMFIDLAVCYSLCHLSTEDLNQALELVSQDNPSFKLQQKKWTLTWMLSGTTLWRLKFFVREALEQEADVDVVASGKTDETQRGSAISAI